MSKIVWHALLSAALLTPSFASAATEMFDADNFEQAVMMVSIDYRKVEELRLFCTKLQPEHKLTIHASSLLWLDKSPAESRVVLGYAKTAPTFFKTARESTVAIWLGTIRALPVAAQKNLCANFFNEIQAGKRTVASQLPRASMYLVEHLKNNPRGGIELSKFDFLMGCSKANFNRVSKSRGEFDLDVSLRVCDCLHDVNMNNTTQAERDAQMKAAREGRPPSELPHLVRIAPLMEQCVKKG